MRLSLFLHRVFSIFYIGVMCNTMVMPAFYTLSGNDFDYAALMLTEEETKNISSIVEEEEKLFSYTLSFDFTGQECLQNKQFLSKQFFLKGDCFREILLPPPEQNLV